MTLLADYVRAPDNRVIGIRCSVCGLVFANTSGATSQRHSDHTWECHPPTDWQATNFTAAGAKCPGPVRGMGATAPRTPGTPPHPDGANHGR